MLSIQYSYEQLTHIHPEVDEYKLYYAQVSFNGEYVWYQLLHKFFATSQLIVYILHMVILLYGHVQCYTVCLQV